MLDTLFVLLPRNTTGDVHHTLVYMGSPEQGAPSFELCTRLAQGLAMLFIPPKAIVVGHDMFDVDNSTPVATLQGNDLYSVRTPIEWLANSKWGYAPHISAQPNYPLPPIGTEIEFDRIAIWYGEDRIAYRFGTAVRAAV